MKVLSTISSASLSCASSARAAISLMTIIGFDGVSTRTARVFSWNAARTVSRSLVSTNECVIPKSLKTVLRTLKVPPYSPCVAMTWSPARRSMILAETAAMPEENASPCRPDSRPAM